MAAVAAAARCGLGNKPAVVFATAAGSLATYACTSFRLALAHPEPSGAVWAAFLKFAAVFSVAQFPVAMAVPRVIVHSGGVRIAGCEAWAQR